jgi:small subunit ribosomal protein S13
MDMTQEFNEIVRIFGTDLFGANVVWQELTRIKGVGPTLARAILNKLGIPINKRVGFLTEDEIKAIEDVIKNLDKHFPEYLFNRRFDRFTGESIHLLGSDLAYTIERDIEFEKSIGSWRGLRHKLGLKVRGQRTKTTGRKTKRPVGVRRKKK